MSDIVNAEAVNARASWREVEVGMTEKDLMVERNIFLILV